MAGRPGKTLLSKDKKGFVIHKNQAYIQIISHPWPRPGIGNLMFAIEVLEKLIALIK
jgi:hypothetical protein